MLNPASHTNSQGLVELGMCLDILHNKQPDWNIPVVHSPVKAT